jgi:hypothetical protein
MFTSIEYDRIQRARQKTVCALLHRCPVGTIGLPYATERAATEAIVEGRNMKRMMASRDFLSRAVLAAAIAGAALVGVTVPASAGPAVTGLSAAMDDPGCEAFGWRHPMCAGGAWADESASQEWGPANDGIGPLPDGGGQAVPDINGGLTEPGMPGAI